MERLLYDVSIHIRDHLLKATALSSTGVLNVKYQKII